MKYRITGRLFPILASLFLATPWSVADQTDAIRGIPLTDLVCEEQGLQKHALERLHDELGVPQDPREPLPLSEDEVGLVLNLVRDLRESQPSQFQRRDPEITGAFSRLKTCASLTRDILCRCENREALAFALQHALEFSNAWSIDNDDFAARWLGADAQFQKVRGVPVGHNNIVAALILSKVATPELLLDLIASGEVKIPWPRGMRGAKKTREERKDAFVSMGAYVIAQKLDIQRSRGKTGLIEAEDLPIRDGAPRARMAREIRGLAVQIQDPKSDIVHDLRKQAKKAPGSQ